MVACVDFIDLEYIFHTSLQGLVFTVVLYWLASLFDIHVCLVPNLVIKGLNPGVSVVCLV